MKLPMRVGFGGHAHGRAWRAVQELHGARPMQTSKCHLLRRTMDSYDVLKTMPQGRGGFGDG
jgi:hypothetical protein